MKKSLFLLLLACITTLGSFAFNYRINYDNTKVSVNHIELVGNTYSDIHYDKLFNVFNSVQLSLPVQQIKVSVPYNANNIKLSVTSNDSDTLVTKYPVVPYIDENSNHMLAQINAVEQSTNIGEIDFVDYAFGGHKIVSISIYPITNTSDPQTFKFHKTIDLNLTWDLYDDVSEDSLALITGPMIADGMEEVKEWVINPTDVEKNAPFYPSPLSVDADDAGIIDYLIIAPDKLCSALKELKQIRRMKGYRSEIVPLSHILESGLYVGDDNLKAWTITDEAGKLRKYIKERYKNDGVRNVLLAGKYPEMPIRYYKIYAWMEPVPTDVYFSELNSVWMVNSIQNTYTPKGGCFISDVNVGRIPFENEEEVKNYISKIKIYEFNPGNGDASYLGRIFQARQNEYWIAHYFTNDTLRYIQDTFESSHFFDNEIGSKIVDHLNTKPAGCWQFFGHGCPEGVKIYQGNETYDHGSMLALANQYKYLKPNNGAGIDQITNKYYPSWQYSISCSTIPFDIYQEGDQIYNVTKNFGESYILGKDYGGVAFLGCTREYSIHQACLTMIHFYTNIKRYYNSTQHITPITSGAMISESHGYESSNKFFSNKDRALFNLLGDPLVPLFIREPNKVTAKETYKNGKFFYCITNTSQEKLLYGKLDLNLRNAADLTQMSADDLSAIDIFPNHIQTVYGKNTLPVILPVHLYGITLYDTEFFCNTLTIQNDALIPTLKKNANRIDNDGKVVVAKDHYAKIHAMGFTAIGNLLQLEENSAFELYCDKDVEIDNIYVPDGAKLKINARGVYIGDYGIQKHKNAIVELISRESEPQRIKRKGTPSNTNNLVVKGRTWWYQSEQRTNANHQEFGIRIGDQVEIDGENWNRVIMAMYTEPQKYGIDATEVKTDTTTIAYIREDNGHVITRAAGTDYDRVSTIPALGSYLQGSVFDLIAPFHLYRFGKIGEKGIYGFDEQYGDTYTIQSIEQISNSGIKYQKYVSMPNAPTNILWIVPNGTYDYVEGIGSPTEFLLFPYWGGDTNAFGWNPPQLSYVTEGDDNRVIFEAAAGQKIWVLSGVENVTIEGEVTRQTWYTLQGIRIDRPTVAGIYIRRNGRHSEKVIIK